MFVILEEGAGRFILSCRDLGLPKVSRFICPLFLASYQVWYRQKIVSNRCRVR